MDHLNPILVELVVRERLRDADRAPVIWLEHPRPRPTWKDVVNKVRSLKWRRPQDPTLMPWTPGPFAT